MPRDIYNVNIESQLPLVSPQELKDALPVDDDLAEAIVASREDVIRILNHEDDRLLIITGPCSIHDPEAALDYARRLTKLRDRYSDKLNLVMRVYFEKPRTSLGWRGLIVDPHLDGSYHIHEGLREARRLLIEIARMGMPMGTEVLDPIIPQYIADLISWSAVGARTTESQTHREITSGLSMAVGFKNGNRRGHRQSCQCGTVGTAWTQFHRYRPRWTNLYFQDPGKPDRSYHYARRVFGAELL